MTSSFGVLRKEEDLFDLTLISDDEVLIPAHKLVLSASSPFFKSILKQSSNSHPFLYLGGVNSEILHSVLDYIYHGQIQILQEQLQVFFDVAKKFRIDGLLSTHVSKVEQENVVKEAEKQFIKIEPDLNKHVSNTETDINKHVSNTETDINEHVSNTDPKESKVRTDSWMDQIEGLLSSNASQSSIVTADPFVNESIGDSDTEEFVEELDEDFDEELISEQSNERFQNVVMSEVDVKIDELIEIKDGKKCCKVCDYTSVNSGHIKEHVELHIDGVKYTCQYCKKSFHSRGIFRRHQKKQHKIQMSDIDDKIESLIKKIKNRYHCIVCDYNSKQTTHLREHVEIHIDGLSYPCTFCGKVLRTMSSHRMHLNKYHKMS